MSIQDAPVPQSTTAQPSVSVQVAVLVVRLPSLHSGCWLSVYPVSHVMSQLSPWLIVPLPDAQADEPQAPLVGSVRLLKAHVLMVHVAAPSATAPPL